MSARSSKSSGKHQKEPAAADRRTTLFGAFSMATSFVFVFYGVSILTGGESPLHLTAFAWVTAGYGLGNLAILSWARNTRDAWCASASMGLAICYLGIFAVDAFSAGGAGSMRPVGLLLVALMLWCNWFAVHLVVSRRRRRS